MLSLSLSHSPPSSSFLFLLSFARPRVHVRERRRRFVSSSPYSIFPHLLRTQLRGGGNLFPLFPPPLAGIMERRKFLSSLPPPLAGISERRRKFLSSLPLLPHLLSSSAHVREGRRRFLSSPPSLISCCHKGEEEISLFSPPTPSSPLIFYVLREGSRRFISSLPSPSRARTHVCA